MPSKKAELQIPLKEILDHKEGKHGKMFKIKIAHYKAKWVSEIKLSPGAAKSYLMKSPLPKRAWVLLARRYIKAPVKTNTKNIRSFFGKRAPSKDDESETPEKKKSRSVNETTTKTTKTNTTPTKKNITPTKKRGKSKMLLEGWCGQSRVYIKRFNTILDTKDKSELFKLINEAKELLNPNQECDHLFTSEKFLTGDIIKHNKDNINCLSASETTLNKIRCDVCDDSFEFSRGCRAILHCFNKTHVANLKKKQADNSQERELVENFTQDGHNEENIVRCVQNFVAQQIALKGLPFTAGVYEREG